MNMLKMFLVGLCWLLGSSVLGKRLIFRTDMLSSQHSGLCCDTLSPDQLQASPLAKELPIIARYAEGYDLGPGSILPTIEHVACLLYPKPMSASGYALPPDLHQRPL
jgi:hypothetical protein